MKMDKEFEQFDAYVKDKTLEGFIQGIQYACEHIYSRCKHESMPYLLDKGDDSMYLSLSEIKSIIKEVKEEDNTKKMSNLDLLIKDLRSKNGNFRLFVTESFTKKEKYNDL